MKRITVNDRWQIKQLLYGDSVLAIRDDSCYAFGGFQLWWYDKRHDVCRCCRSRWADFRRLVEEHSLDRAADILWHSRNALFLRHKRLSQDRRLTLMAQFCN